MFKKLIGLTLALGIILGMFTINLQAQRKVIRREYYRQGNGGEVVKSGLFGAGIGAALGGAFGGGRGAAIGAGFGAAAGLSAGAARQGTTEVIEYEEQIYPKQNEYTQPMEIEQEGLEPYEEYEQEEYMPNEIEPSYAEQYPPFEKKNLTSRKRSKSRNRLKAEEKLPTKKIKAKRFSNK
jgi:hypothetical protein